jgi:hypothetical protein
LGVQRKKKKDKGEQKMNKASLEEMHKVTTEVKCSARNQEQPVCFRHELTPGLPPEAGQALSASQRGVPLFNFAILRFCNPSSRYLSDFQLPQSPEPSALNLESLAPCGRCLRPRSDRREAPDAKHQTRSRLTQNPKQFVAK